MELSAAQEFLAPHRQWLPFRPPLADGCTLGGMVALGACGPERLAYGAPRDALLGLRFVSGAAKQIKAGGRVIKNVAGYDITRLLAGSAGTLGLLTELTFRVSAIPEVCRLIRASGTLAQCAAAAAQLLRSKLNPIFVCAVRSAPGLNLESGIRNLESPPWAFSAGFESFEATVAAQLDAGSALLKKAGLSGVEAESYPLYQGTHAELFRVAFDAPFVLRVDVPLGALPGLAEALPRSGDALLDFGCGRATLGLPALSDEQWAAIVAAAEKAGGHVVLGRAPLEFKKAHDVFAPELPDWKIMHRLKAALDPHGIFAPGRLPGRR
jgi:FAD/FMN-containing dehydrogenase